MQKDKYVYATYLPDENEVNIPKEITIQSMQPAKGSKVYLLGNKKPLNWEQSETGILIKLPEGIQNTPPCKHAWVFRMEKINVLK